MMVLVVTQINSTPIHHFEFFNISIGSDICILVGQIVTYNEAFYRIYAKSNI